MSTLRKSSMTPRGKDELCLRYFLFTKDHTLYVFKSQVAYDNRSFIALFYY